MAIDATIDQLLGSLQQEVIGIHAYWINYRQLFAHSQARLDLLNDCAGSFFYIVQDVLLADVQLSLSKLADPPATFGKENASLERLANAIIAVSASESSPQEASELPKLLEDYRTACKGIVGRRNKALAHADLAVTLQLHGH